MDDHLLKLPTKCHQRRSQSEDWIEEIMKSINYMSGELSNIYKQQKLLLDMMGQIKELQKLNEEEDKNSLT